MKRLLCLCALAAALSAASTGCSLTYYHSSLGDGHRNSEFGLLGMDPFHEGRNARGLIPLYRSSVERMSAEDESE